MPIAHFLDRPRSSWTGQSLPSALCTLHSATAVCLGIRLLPRNLHAPFAGALRVVAGSSKLELSSSLERPLLLHACFVNRGAGAALAIHPTQTIQGNGHSHCRKKVSSPRTEFGVLDGPRRPRRPIVLVATPVAAAYPRSRFHRSARLSHVELNLHSCASGRKRAEAERHFQALRKADDLTCFTSLHRAVSVSGNVLGPDGERTWSYGRFWHYQSRRTQLRYVPIAIPDFVPWNNFHAPTVMRVLSHCDVDLSTAGRHQC